MVKCAKKKCKADALEDRKLCEYHNEKNKERVRRGREENKQAQIEKEPSVNMNSAGFRDHFLSKEGQRDTSRPAFIEINEARNSVRVTDTAVRDTSHIEQTRTTSRDFKNQTEHEEVKTVITTEVTKIQREIEQVSTRVQSIYLEKLKANVTCDNIQENPDLKLLDDTPDAVVERISIRIDMSFYETYAHEAVKESAEIELDRENIKRSFKGYGVCPLLTLEERMILNDMLPDVPNPTQTVRDNFGRDISILILKRKLDMKQYRLQLIQVIPRRKENSAVFLSRAMPGLSEEYEEAMKQDILNLDVSDYDMYARCYFLDIERDLKQPIDILVSVYQIYLKRRREDDTVYKRVLNFGFEGLQQKDEFKKEFLPPNYLDCKDYVKDMDRVYQLCAQRDFEMPPPGTEDPLSEKVRNVLQKYTFLRDKNIDRYFPKSMYNDLKEYNEDFNRFYASDEHKNALKQKKKRANPFQDQIDMLKRGICPPSKRQRRHPYDDERDRFEQDRRDFMN